MRCLSVLAVPTALAVALALPVAAADNDLSTQPDGAPAGLPMVD